MSSFQKGEVSLGQSCRLLPVGPLPVTFETSSKEAKAYKMRPMCCHRGNQLKN